MDLYVSIARFRLVRNGIHCVSVPQLTHLPSAFAKNSFQVFVQTCFQVHVDEQRGLCLLGA